MSAVHTRTVYLLAVIFSPKFNNKSPKHNLSSCASMFDFCWNRNPVILQVSGFFLIFVFAFSFMFLTHKSAVKLFWTHSY